MDIQLSDEVSQAYLAEVEDILNNKEFLHSAFMNIISGQPD